MTFYRDQSPYLPTLAAFLEEYSASQGSTVSVHARVTNADLTGLDLTDSQGESISPTQLETELSAEITRLIQAGNIPADCDLRLQTTQVEVEVEVEATPGETDQAVEEPLDASSSEQTPQNKTPRRAANNGMVLRNALVERGHTHGYTHEEVQAAEKNQETLPEVRFLRTLVRNGVIAHGPHGDISASELNANFGAEFAEEVVALPAQTPQSAVKSSLGNPLWVEIAHDSQLLYAVDLDPAANGAVGQVIARPAQTAAAPYLVAESLSDFVSGEWVQNIQDDAAPASPAPAVETATVWQAVASVLEPSEEAVSADASGAETEEVSAAEAFAASDKTVENGEIVEAPAADSEEPVLAEPVLVDEPATGSIAVEQAEPATLTAPTPQVEETITVEPDDTEEEIVDFRYELATHNADKLNETERGLAEDFATIAFGTKSEDRLERVQKRWENETVEAAPSDAAKPKTNSIPKTRCEAMEQENPAGLRSVLKKFFLN